MKNILIWKMQKINKLTCSLKLEKNTDFPCPIKDNMMWNFFDLGGEYSSSSPYKLSGRSSNQNLSGEWIPLVFVFVIDVYMVIVFNATFKNISIISLRPALLVEEAGVDAENLLMFKRFYLIIITILVQILFVSCQTSPIYVWMNPTCIGSTIVKIVSRSFLDIILNT
jgi:hypothetical protein